MVEISTIRRVVKKKNAPHIGKQPKSRTKTGLWRKKRVDTGKKRKKFKKS